MQDRSIFFDYRPIFEEIFIFGPNFWKSVGVYHFQLNSCSIFRKGIGLNLGNRYYWRDFDRNISIIKKYGTHLTKAIMLPTK